MNAAIYIPTRARWFILPRVVPAYQSFGLPVYLVYEPWETKAAEYARDKFGCQTLRLRQEDKGVAYARQAALMDAKRRGYVSILMSDDDHQVTRKSDVRGMLELAAREDMFGIGAWKGSYDMFKSHPVTKVPSKAVIAAKKYGPGAYISRDGAAHQVMALNIDNVLKVGGFDTTLSNFEDDELQRLGIYALGLPWCLYPSVHCTSLLKRHAPGGMASIKNTKAAAWAEIRQRWPGYIKGTTFFNWVKFMDDHLGEVRTRPFEDVEVGKKPYDWSER